MAYATELHRTQARDMGMVRRMKVGFQTLSLRQTDPFTQIFDPSGYQPINHTFMIWVMVIVGGAGNNWGVVLGSFLIYIVWVISDPIAQVIFLNLSSFTDSMGWGAIPEIESRSLQMRVFVLGVVITIALRFAPRGLIPEVVKRA